DRFRFRTEGRAGDGSLASGEMNALYGRAVARWWELVAGVRHDFRPGPSRTWAAIGIQGLAPYWFDVQATAYVGGAGRTALRVEASARFSARARPGCACATRFAASWRRTWESCGSGRSPARRSWHARRESRPGTRASSPDFARGSDLLRRHPHGRRRVRTHYRHPLPHAPRADQPVAHVGIGLRERLGRGGRLALEEQEGRIDRIGDGAAQNQVAAGVRRPREGEVFAAVL